MTGRFLVEREKVPYLDFGEKIETFDWKWMTVLSGRKIINFGEVSSILVKRSWVVSTNQNQQNEIKGLINDFLLAEKTLYLGHFEKFIFMM